MRASTPEERVLELQTALQQAHEMLALLLRDTAWTQDAHEMRTARLEAIFRQIDAILYPKTAEEVTPVPQGKMRWTEHADRR